MNTAIRYVFYHSATKQLTHRLFESGDETLTSSGMTITFIVY